MPALALVAAGTVVGVRLSADETTTTVAGEAKAGETTEAKPEATTEAATKDPSPLTIANKELFWSLGSFLVLLALMRLVLYPRLKAGQDARQAQVTGRHAEAEATRSAAQAEVDEYREAIAAVGAEAQARVDAAARTVETERVAAMAEANARIAEQRAVTMAEVDAARSAVAGSVAEAARAVSADVAGRVLGRAPDASVVAASVERTMTAGVAS